MGSMTKNDCPFCADKARERREEFERDVLPEIKEKHAAERGDGE